MASILPAWAVLGLWALTGAACGGESLSDAQQALVGMRLAPSDLKIVGAVDHADRTYRVGEPIVLSVEVNKPAYVAVLRVLPTGDTTIVFPNRAHASAQVAANTPLRIPDQGAPLTVMVPKSGTAMFEFVAAERGASWLFSRRPAGSADFAELGATTRALAKDILASLPSTPGAGTAAAHLDVQIEGK